MPFHNLDDFMVSIFYVYLDNILVIYSRRRPSDKRTPDFRKFARLVDNEKQPPSPR